MLFKILRNWFIISLNLISLALYLMDRYVIPFYLKLLLIFHLLLPNKIFFFNGFTIFTCWWSNIHTFLIDWSNFLIVFLLLKLWLMQLEILVGWIFVTNWFPRLVTLCRQRLEIRLNCILLPSVRLLCNPSRSLRLNLPTCSKLTIVSCSKLIRIPTLVLLLIILLPHLSLLIRILETLDAAHMLL